MAFSVHLGTPAKQQQRKLYFILFFVFATNHHISRFVTDDDYHYHDFHTERTTHTQPSGVRDNLKTQQAVCIVPSH